MKLHVGCECHKRVKIHKEAREKFFKDIWNYWSFTKCTFRELGTRFGISTNYAHIIIRSDPRYQGQRISFQGSDCRDFRRRNNLLTDEEKAEIRAKKMEITPAHILAKEKEWQIKRLTRIAKILELRFVYKMTLEETGNEIGVTRERIRQVLAMFPVEYAADKEERKALLRVEYTFKCGNCGKEQTHVRHKRNPPKEFCSRQCKIAHRFKDHVYKSGKTEEEWREYNRRKSREWYWNVGKKKPNWKDIVHEPNQSLRQKESQRISAERRIQKISGMTQELLRENPEFAKK